MSTPHCFRSAGGLVIEKGRGNGKRSAHKRRATHHAQIIRDHSLLERHRVCGVSSNNLTLVSKHLRSTRCGSRLAKRGTPQGVPSATFALQVRGRVCLGCRYERASAQTSSQTRAGAGTLARARAYARTCVCVCAHTRLH